MDFSNFGKCLEVVERGPPRVGRDYAVLRVYRDKGLFDVSPFFDDFFLDRCDGRDLHYQAPDFPRKVEGNGFADYQFNMYEFAETFFFHFSPKQMTEFLGYLLPDSSDSKEFLEDILRFEDRNLIAFPFYQNVSRSNNNQYRFLPINFCVDEMNKFIQEVIPKNGMLNRRYLNFWGIARQDLNEKIGEPKKSDFSIPISAKGGRIDDKIYSSLYLEKLRREGIRRVPQIVFPTFSGHLGSLDSWSFIRQYPVNLDNLEIVRTE